MENQQEKIKEIGEESFKFVLVGISGLPVNLITIYFFFEFLGVSEFISLAIGIFVSMSTNYYFNRKWTFQSNNFWLPEYFKFLLSNSIGGMIQLSVAYLIVETGNDKFDLIFFNIPMIYVASSIGIGFGFIFNFIVSKLFVFQKEE